MSYGTLGATLITKGKSAANLRRHGLASERGEASEVAVAGREVGGARRAFARVGSGYAMPDTAMAARLVANSPAGRSFVADPNTAVSHVATGSGWTRNYGPTYVTALQGLGRHLVPGSEFRGIPERGPRYATWYDRAYGPPEVPGLSGGISQFLPIIAGYAAGGTGGALQAYQSQQQADAAQKAADKAATAAAKQAKLAAQQNFAMTQSQTKFRNILLFGGLGVLALGITLYVLKKK